MGTQLFHPPIETRIARIRSHFAFSSPSKDGTYPAFILKGAVERFLFVASHRLTQLVKQWPHRREVKLSIPQVIKARSQCQRLLVVNVSTRFAALFHPGALGQVLLFMFYSCPLWAGNEVHVARFGMHSVSISKDVGLSGVCSDVG